MTELTRRKNLVFLLYSLVIFLPLFEAPKNIICGLILLYWSWCKIKSKDFSGLKSYSAQLIVFWVASASLVEMVALYKGYSVGGWGDIIRYSLVAIVALDLNLEEGEKRVLAIALCVSAAFTLILGLYRLYFVPGYNTLKMNSVGHVNHSAIYLVLVFCVSLSMTFLSSRRSDRVVFGVLSILFFSGVLISQSRAAILGATLALCLFIWQQRKLIARKHVFSILIAGIILAPLSLPVVEKHFSWTHNYSGKLSPREKINNLSVLAWKQNPIWGAGYYNYGKEVTPQNVKAWGGDPENEELYFFAPHAHNQYLSLMVEGGIFGLVSYLLFLSGWAYMISRKGYKKEVSSVWRVASMMALVSLVTIGFFNTPFHHENAILLMLLYALSVRNPGAKKVEC